MKPKNFNLIVLAVIIILINVSAGYNQGYIQKKKRIIYNNDGNNILNNWLHNHRPLTVEDVEKNVDLVAGTAVTTFSITSGKNQPYYFSEFERPIGVLAADQKNMGEKGHV